MRKNFNDHVLTKEDYWNANAAAYNTIVRLRDTVANFATHQKPDCNESTGVCSCGLFDALLVCESRIDEFKTLLQRLSFDRRSDLKENTQIVTNFTGWKRSKKNDAH